MIARYFVAERDAIDELEAEARAVEQHLDEMREEHGGEDGLLSGGRSRPTRARSRRIGAKTPQGAAEGRSAKDPEEADDGRALEACADCSTSGRPPRRGEGGRGRTGREARRQYPS